MNKVEAFKNELKNYYFYKNELKRLNNILDKTNALDRKNDDDAMKLDNLLIPFSNWLKEISNQLDATFVQLTGFKAIRYDAEPSMANEELSTQMKLDLIDRYNKQLDERKRAWLLAESTLLEDIERITDNLNHLDAVLDRLPPKIKAVCLDVYGKGYSYESMVGTTYWSVSSLYREVYEALEKALY